ncbi:MAG: Flp pilus assembly protein CpaB [Chloroflexi bacterium]|nr:Flp pilus assembly protein CpaB [Chloroflexota bacterium]
MAVATLTPARALRARPRRADPRALIGVFITLAALAGSVAFWVGSSDARPVLVATRELPVGTTLRSSDLTIAYVRMDDALYRAALPADMLEALVGRQLGEPMHAQQVLARAQVAGPPGLVADQVAITIPARPDSAVDGRLRPGDAVEVLVTVVDKTRNEAHTRQVLERAQVFGIGRDRSFGSSGTNAESDALPPGSITSVTLAISAEQARQLAEARRTGELDVLLLPAPEVAQP